jgi:ribonuclease T1
MANPLPAMLAAGSSKTVNTGCPRAYIENTTCTRKYRVGAVERIVIEQRTGKAYYSGDHYRTFIPMN